MKKWVPLAIVLVLVSGCRGQNTGHVGRQTTPSASLSPSESPWVSVFDTHAPIASSSPTPSQSAAVAPGAGNKRTVVPTPATHKPVPTPVKTTASGSDGNLTPGAFCSQHGETRLHNGVNYTCSLYPNGKWRWKRG